MTQPILLLGIAWLLVGCSTITRESQDPPPWGETVGREVSTLGIQNWIIVAEASFPVVSRRGVRTIVVDAEIPEMVDFIISHLEKSSTVVPAFSTSRELPFVKNDNAPGIDEFRKNLTTALHGHPVREMDHRSLTLLAHSDANKFAVLVFKTKTALPYSSVFIELNTGYWDAPSEEKLRNEMQGTPILNPTNETQDRGNRPRA